MRYVYETRCKCAFQGQLIIKKTIICIGGFKLPDQTASAVRVMDNAYLLKELGYDIIIGRLPKEGGEAVSQKIINGFDCFNIEYPKNNSPKIMGYINRFFKGCC